MRVGTLVTAAIQKAGHVVENRLSQRGGRRCDGRGTVIRKRDVIIIILDILVVVRAVRLLLELFDLVLQISLFALVFCFLFFPFLLGFSGFSLRFLPLQQVGDLIGGILHRAPIARCALFLATILRACWRLASKAACCAYSCACFSVTCCRNCCWRSCAAACRLEEETAEG